MMQPSSSQMHQEHRIPRPSHVAVQAEVQTVPGRHFHASSWVEFGLWVRIEVIREGRNVHNIGIQLVGKLNQKLIKAVVQRNDFLFNGRALPMDIPSEIAVFVPPIPLPRGIVEVGQAVGSDDRLGAAVCC